MIERMATVMRIVFGGADWVASKDYGYDEESRECAEVKKAATKGTAINLSETGEEK